MLGDRADTVAEDGGVDSQAPSECCRNMGCCAFNPGITGSASAIMGGTCGL